MKAKILFGALESVAACGSPSTPPPPSSVPEVEVATPRAADGGMLLEKGILDKQIKRAELGDGMSAFRVSRHFESLGHAERARYWLLYAAARGHTVAQYNLWFELKGSSDCRSKVEALAWANSAVFSGAAVDEFELRRSIDLAVGCFE